MTGLRRTLQLLAAVWAVLGILSLLAPGVITVGLFDQRHPPQPAWIRLLGVESVTLAMFMVLVAHRIEDLWWWSWALALMTTGFAGVLILHAAFGLAPGQSAVMWWAAAALTVGFDLALLFGLFVVSRGRPLP